MLVISLFAFWLCAVFASFSAQPLAQEPTATLHPTHSPCLQKARHMPQTLAPESPPLCRIRGRKKDEEEEEEEEEKEKEKEKEKRKEEEEEEEEEDEEETMKKNVSKRR